MTFNSAIVPDERNQRWSTELKKYVELFENTEISVFFRQKENSYAEISVYRDLVYSLTLD